MCPVLSNPAPAYSAALPKKDELIADLNPSTGDPLRYPQNGNRTPTASAVEMGIENLNDREKEREDSKKKKRKVKKVLLLVTDGLANAPLNGLDNCFTNDSVHHPLPPNCNNDPDWQSKMYNGDYDPPNSSVGATVELLKQAKADGVEVFIIAAALQNNRPEDLKFDLMVSAPEITHLYNAGDGGDMSTVVQQVKDIIYDECAVDTDDPREADGAEVILHDANTGDIFKKTTTDRDGKYTLLSVEAGRNYTLEIRHLDVEGGDDEKCNYDLLYVNANQTGPIPFDIKPEHSGKVTMDNVTLQINPDEANTICPAP